MEKEIRNRIITVGAIWIIVMIWLVFFGFTFDTATITTGIVAILGYELHQNNRMSKMEGELILIVPVVKDLLEKRIRNGKD